EQHRRGQRNRNDTDQKIGESETQGGPADNDSKERAHGPVEKYESGQDREVLEEQSETARLCRSRAEHDEDRGGADKDESPDFRGSAQRHARAFYAALASRVESVGT